MLRRARSCGEYIAETGCTVRDCAAHFGISKSTVHKDITERLKDVDENLYREVRRVLGVNLAQRHIRGGDATRRKFAAKHDREREGICIRE